MSMIERTLVVGSGSKPVAVTLTDAAAEMIDGLTGLSGTLEDQRSLLTTIVVGRTAAGTAGDDPIVVDAADILQVIEHAGTARRD